VLLLISFPSSVCINNHNNNNNNNKKNSSGKHAKVNYINMAISIIIYKYARLVENLILVSFRNNLYETTQLSNYITFLVLVFSSYNNCIIVCSSI